MSQRKHKVASSESDAPQGWQDRGVYAMEATGCSHECAPLLVRSGRPGRDGRAAKSPKVPRTPRAPKQVNGVTVPSCTLPLATPALFDGRLSVRAAFRGATLLLTGGTGFVGSVVLEQLLRVQPDIERIFVIIRAKRSVPGDARMDALLRRPLFHLHHVAGEFPSEVRRKIVVVSGDLCQPGLGLAAADRRRLCREVNHVVHCAASISFVEPVHSLLAQNYVATRCVAELAAGMRRLRGFVHVSTAYVNSNCARGSHVEERMYPLRVADGRSADHAAIAAELAALPPRQAERQARPRAASACTAAAYLRQTGHVNAYTLTKSMTEQLIASFHSAAFPVAIVRPSIVGAIARAPLPGYVGNSAGATAYFMAYATGMATYTCHRPHHVFDVVPADVCAAVILATGAALTQCAMRGDVPVVVHTCSSCTNPRAHADLLREVVHPFWDAQPPPRRFTAEPYKTADSPQAYLDEASWRFWALCRLGDAKFWLISLLLRLLGYAGLAAKVWGGWQAWRTYNTSALDFNIFYCARNSHALAAVIAPEEAAAINVTWEAPRDDLKQYFTTHMQYMRSHFFKQANN